MPACLCRRAIVEVPADPPVPLLPRVRSTYDYDDFSDEKRSDSKGSKIKWTKGEVRGSLPPAHYAKPARFKIARPLRLYSACAVRQPVVNCAIRVQDAMLKDAVKKFGMNSWRKVADALDSDKSDVQCQLRYQKVLNPSVVKGPWTKEVCSRERSFVAALCPPLSLDVTGSNSQSCACAVVCGARRT